MGSPGSTIDQSLEEVKGPIGGSWLFVDAFIRCLLRTKRSGAFEPACTESGEPLLVSQ